LFLGTYSFPSPLTTPKDYDSLSTPLPSEALPKLLLGMDSGIRIEEKTTSFVAEKLHHKRLLLKTKKGHCCWLWTALIKISRRWIFCRREKSRKNTIDLSIIYSSRILCLSFVLSYSCHPVIFAERSAILLVSIIKLTKETRWRVCRGRDTDGEIVKGQIGEGGCE
jgi:hypothetical protein